jgi:hypothetical protein
MVHIIACPMTMAKFMTAAAFCDGDLYHVFEDVHVEAICMKNLKLYDFASFSN